MSQRFVSRIAIAALVTGSLVAPATDVAAQSPPPLVPFTGTVASGAGMVTLTLNIYAEATGGDSLWTETQNVEVDAQGQFQALLGLTAASGLPAELFTDNETRWLGVSANGQPEAARTLLTSVPYALKAADANTLGGLPASAFLLADGAGSLADTAGDGVPSPQTDGDGGLGEGVLGDTSGEGLVDTSGDQVILDDLIVDGSICAGLDCVNGESFGFDTIRIKENNLRIRAVDTSSTASFPTNDWQITFNDSSNGGQNKFSIDDIDGGRTPFTIEAGTPSHALYVDSSGSGGRIGFGTSTPVVDLHVKSGNTPTLRLEQDGSSGFTAQTWDVAGNEANFFIRDATSGSTLPFRIEPGAPSNGIVIDTTGDIGLGTNSPSQDLHVRRTSGSTFVRVESTGSSNTGFQFMNSALSGTPWNAFTNSSGAFTLANGAVNGAAIELTLDTSGNAIFGGTITTSGSCSIGCDAVFEADYPLASIEEHADAMWRNGYLPGVGPTSEEEPWELVDKTGRILNELETAHIYIEQLLHRVEALEAASKQ